MRERVKTSEARARPMPAALLLRQCHCTMTEKSALFCCDLGLRASSHSRR